MESINKTEEALNDPRTPLGLVYVTMLLFTSELMRAGIITDPLQVKDIQERAFRDSLEVYQGKKEIQYIHPVETLNS